ncbi:MAG: RidA family protein [Longimicrobiales bacterium]|nr:RidA family protein [Longimicrobiales bacterium]
MSFQRVNPDELGPPKGWTNGMLSAPGGRILFVAGQDAANADGVVVAEDFVEQFDIALRKVMAVVKAAGGDAECVGRMTVFVTDVEAYRASRSELGAIWRSHMDRHYPAMALVEVRRLVDPRGKVEIQATAVIREA